MAMGLWHGMLHVRLHSLDQRYVMAHKQYTRICITVCGQEYVRDDWTFDFDGEVFTRFLTGLTREMRGHGIDIVCERNHDHRIKVNSYADLLNCVRVASDESMGTHCIGHVIGKSEHLDITEDIAAAVRRVAFAPETVAPAGEFRKVCHNCGCGC